MRRLSLAVATILAAGCAFYVDDRHGETLHQSALLYEECAQSPAPGMLEVKVAAIDGSAINNRADATGACHPLPLPAGPHSIDVVVDRIERAKLHSGTSGGTAVVTQRLELDAVAGRAYQLRVNAGAAWRGDGEVWIEEPLLDSLEGKSFYTCCTLRFDEEEDEATDANYLYDKVLPAGTRVTVARVRGTGLDLLPAGGDEVVTLYFEYGLGKVRMAEYFRMVLKDVDPLPAHAGDSPAVIQAVRDGRLLAGMTKEQVLMARSYPPFHHTPSLDSDVWLYFDSALRAQRAEFKDGALQSLEHVHAP